MISFALLAVAPFPTGEELFAEVDRRLANVRSYCFETVDVVGLKSTIATFLEGLLIRAAITFGIRRLRGEQR